MLGDIGIEGRHGSVAWCNCVMMRAGSGAADAHGLLSRNDRNDVFGFEKKAVVIIPSCGKELTMW